MIFIYIFTFEKVEIVKTLQMSQKKVFVLLLFAEHINFNYTTRVLIPFILRSCIIETCLPIYFVYESFQVLTSNYAERYNYIKILIHLYKTEIRVFIKHQIAIIVT